MFFNLVDEVLECFAKRDALGAEDELVKLPMPNSTDSPEKTFSSTNTSSKTARFGSVPSRRHFGN